MIGIVYPRRDTGPSFLRFVLFTGIALILGLVQLVRAEYTAAGIMGVAAVLCVGYIVWQARRHGGWPAVRDELRQAWKSLFG